MMMYIIIHNRKGHIMNNAPIIALSGKMASGKSTTARHIARTLFPDNFCITSFASPLSDEVATLMKLYSPDPKVFYNTVVAYPGIEVDLHRLSNFVDVTTSSGMRGMQLFRLMMQEWGTSV